MLNRNGEHAKLICSDLLNVIECDVSKALTHENVSKRYYINCAKLATNRLDDFSNRQEDVPMDGTSKNVLLPCKCQVLNSDKLDDSSHKADIFNQSSSTEYINKKPSIHCQGLEHDKEENNNNDKEILQPTTSSNVEKTFKNDTESQQKLSDLLKHRATSTSNNNTPSKPTLSYSTIKGFGEIGKEIPHTIQRQQNTSHVINGSQNNTFFNNFTHCKHEIHQHKVSPCKYGGCKPSLYNMSALHDKLKSGENQKSRDNNFRSSYMSSDGERLRITPPYTSNAYVDNDIKTSSVYQNSFTSLNGERTRMTMPYNWSVCGENEVNKSEFYRSPYTNLDGERPRPAMPYNSNACDENNTSKSNIYQSLYEPHIFLDDELPRIAMSYNSNTDNIYRSSYTGFDGKQPLTAMSYSSNTFGEKEINKDNIYRSSYMNFDGKQPLTAMSYNSNTFGEKEISQDNIYRSSYTNFDGKQPLTAMSHGSNTCGENEISQDIIYRSPYTNLNGEQPLAISYNSNTCAENEINKNSVYRSSYMQLDGERSRLTMPYSSGLCCENDINKSSTYGISFTKLDGERPVAKLPNGLEYCEDKNVNSYRRQFNINNVGTYRAPGICKPPDTLRCYDHGLLKDSVHKTDYRNHFYDLYNIPMHYGTLRTLENGVTKESVYKKDYNWPCADSETRLQKYFPTGKLKRCSITDCKLPLVPLYSPHNLRITPGSDSLYRREYNSNTAIRVPAAVKQHDHLAFGPGKMSEMTMYRSDYRNPAHLFRRYPFNFR